LELGWHCPLRQQPKGQLEAEQVGSQLPVLALHAVPVPQALQAAPPTPQAELVGGVTQLPAVLQQPVGHVVALQTGGFDSQVPVVVLQVAPLRHALQEAPLIPQAESDGGVMHLSLRLQQPAAHVVASHFAATGSQVWVVLLQVLPVPQSTQASPLLPQAASVVPGSQVLPEQHPLEQLLAPQVCFTHLPVAGSQTVPVSHALHASPPKPQAAFVGGLTHLPVMESQHPLGHVVESQGLGTHTPS